VKVVVTGASGNAGTSVLRALQDEPAVDAVLGVARRIPELSLPKLEWASADVSRDTLEPLFRGADAVVHLAWLIQPSRDSEALRATNVNGSRRVFRAAAGAGVKTLVYASSIGAYSPGPKDRAVDESWPTAGIKTSFYSRHKAEVEQLLNDFEAEHPEVRAVRLRPALKFKREAASEIRRYFAGPLLPNPLLRPDRIPVVPDTPRLVFQAVHTDDVADAYRRAVVSDVRGAFNVAADPVLDPDRLSELLGARKVPVSDRVLRAAAAVTWRARLQPTPEGWVDMALLVPVMDTTRAREELGWEPRHGAGEALRELLDGLHEGSGFPTPPLHAGGSRLRELAQGVGARLQ
jgi:nucleoside-diphosphate-sugar epimerase